MARLLRYLRKNEQQEMFSLAQCPCTGNQGQDMPLKIFVIDDEESIRTTLRWHLEDLGHQVVSAARPQACDILVGHQCRQDVACGDALIIDYRMPGMTGLDFIGRLLQQGCKGSTANMLIISGNIADIDMARVREYGCSVMQKPVSFAELEAWLAKVADNVGKVSDTPG